MSIKNPSVQPRNQHQRNWGNYATENDLPNAPGFVAPVNLLQPLEVGDLAFVNNVGLVQCDSTGVPGDGLAVWSAVRGNASNLTYIPANSGDWNGDPTNVKDALDRLAAAVAGLLGGPIP